MGDQNKGLYNKYRVINRETGQEAEGEYFVLKPVKDPAARAALEAYAEATNNENLRVDLFAWLETMPEFRECDWCGEPATELCRNCWEHDRDVYKGSYGEDIGEFKPIGGSQV